MCGVAGCFGLFLLIIYRDLERSRYFVGFMVVLRDLMWGLVRILVVGICDFCWIYGILSKYVSK